MENKKTGYFITFEGADGSGKTTQLKMLKDYLESKGFEVVETREPGAGDVGTQIRNILLHSDSNISEKCEMFLFLADRANHIETFIKPNLKAGKIVLCDRYIDSTIAYQGYGRGQNIDLLKKLNEIVAGTLKPDLTLLYDVSTQTAMERVGKEKDRMESEGAVFHNKVRNGYLELCKEFPERIKLIDANKSIEYVFENTKLVAEELLRSTNG